MKPFPPPVTTPISEPVTSFSFILLKKRLAGKRFATNADGKQAVTSVLEYKPWCHGGTDMSMVTIRKSGVYHLLPLCRVRQNHNEVFITLLFETTSH